MNYHYISKTDLKNGDGLRVVLWVAGCNHMCKGCHNPETWNACSGQKFDDEAKKEIYNELEKDYVSGITFSGGDPLYPNNRHEVGELIEDIAKKFPNKNIWLYTGYAFEEIKQLPFIKNVDVLVDGPFVESKQELKLKWKGSSNQRVILVKESLLSSRVVERNN